MKHISFLIKSLSVLRDHQPWKLGLIFFLSLVNGLSAGLSIVLLIPLLQVLNIGGGEKLSGLALFFKDITSKSGIELTIGSILLVYLVLFTLMPLLAYWNSLINARYQHTFVYNMRRRLFRKIILADWIILNIKSKNNYLQMLTNEVPRVGNYYFYYLRMGKSLIVITAYIIWAVLISVKVTILIIITGVVLFFLLRKYLFQAFDLGKGLITTHTQLLRYIDDFWQTVKIAKVHGSEDFYYNKFEHSTRSLLSLEYRIQKNQALPQLLFRIASIVILVLVVYIGYKVIEIPITSFIILILLFSRMLPNFMSLNSDANLIISSLPSVRMVMKLDEELTDHQFSVTTQKTMLPVEKVISIKNLVFSYPGGDILFDNFSEDIPAKKITGIIGESGRGKTTLIDIISGLQKPQLGFLSVDGKILDHNILPLWKKSIGYLPQDSFFIEGTIRENLVWDSRKDISDERIWEVLNQVNALHLVKRFKKGLSEFIINFQFHFSGGERQRLALARVLLREPRILLLDEATSALDIENEKQVMEVIVQLKKQVTILFVTHRTSLMPYFDKIIRLNDHIPQNKILIREDI
jgi:ATP-binding cassette, subfamily C, bacterial